MYYCCSPGVRQGPCVSGGNAKEVGTQLSIPSRGGLGGGAFTFDCHHDKIVNE